MVEIYRWIWKQFKVIIMKRLWIPAIILLMAFAQNTVEVLLPREKKGILYMREEEKLARDVYEKMFAQYQAMPFGNIRHSEQMHMKRMETLVAKYKLEDPVKTTKDEPGKFVNPVLQKLYDDLVASGTKSYRAALEAGALIEEIDIADLNKEITGVQNTDVAETYQYLKMASENHLNAFNQRLKTEGVNYKPTVLSQAAFDAIISNDRRGKGMQGGPGMQNVRGTKVNASKAEIIPGNGECDMANQPCCNGCNKQKGKEL